MRKNAFTMIELIFVIVIIAILAVVAIPKLSATRDDAKVARMSQMIATGATEIASFAVAKGTIEDDLSRMSHSVESLVNMGEAVVHTETKSVDFIMGSDNPCITMQVDDGLLDANLSVVLEPFPTSSICESLTNLFDTSDYPIPLRGQRVAK